MGLRKEIMSKKILIAEDERPIANALFNKLKSEGFYVVMVANGQEAIEAMKKEKFNLILLDLMMPIIDGFGVLTKMKEEGNLTSVIVLSNLGQEIDIEKAKALGAKDYFVKADTPIKEIVKKINAALEI